MVRAALYARISRDEAGRERGVQRQLEDARTLAAQRGWTVAGEYVDNSISAYSGARRPEYVRLIADAERGVIDHVVVWQSSRLWRSRVERAQAMEVLSVAGVSVAAVSGPDLQLSTAAGRMMADVVGAFDTGESAVKSERIKREIQQRAEEGRRHGPVPYGWRRVIAEGQDSRRPVKTELEDPDEAKVVREVAERVVAGEALMTIADDLNARAVAPPSRRDGGTWRNSGIRALMTRPANIGLNVHHGEIIGQGEWPPLLDRDTYDAVQAILTDPRRRSSQRASTRQYLLSGDIALCGVCGTPASTKRRGGYTLYRCTKGCVGRAMIPVDDLVSAVVVERLSRPDAAAVLLAPADTGQIDKLRREADVLRRRLDAAAEDYAAGVLDRQQLATITSRLRPQLAEAEQGISRLYSTNDIGDEVVQMFNGDPREGWEALGLHGRRAVLKALGIVVRIMPTTARGRNFNPEDVVIEWGTP